MNRMESCADSDEEQQFWPIPSFTSYINPQTIVAYEESVGSRDVASHMQPICRYTGCMNEHTVDSLLYRDFMFVSRS